MEPDDAPVEIALLGHIGPYHAYDPDDPHKPKPKRRAFPFGFAPPQKAVKRRSPKRRDSRKR